MKKNEIDFSKLKRPRHPMSEYIRDALEQSGMMTAYRARPAYQQNDYIGWITRAKRETTRMKRLTQMISELERGDVYMKMDYRSKQ